jgi:hypothetical protein
MKVGLLEGIFVTRGKNCSLSGKEYKNWEGIISDYEFLCQILGIHFNIFISPPY